MTEQGSSIVQDFEQSPERVFEAVTAVRGWWSKNITGGTAAAGDEFEYDVPGGVHHCRIRVVEVVPNQLVTWLVLDNTFNFVEDQEEWNDTEIRFEISRRDDGRTELRFTHVGLVPEFECYDICHQSWGFYVGHSLRKLITTGQGLPNEVTDGVDVIGGRVEAFAG
ncbi:Activator of Hsp90 ATPase 1 family protein [Kribbella flavida DSM 17836]|uniref:Activator of Hsp90 ATPase 1 family protein n=1 Tax=Kribbella flavida (strain DSM 17836 / JCM 10339 / NBRC 14399) TaxID=479435 RepID=D2PR99_KRIFD|nr:SRPBCC domain-containing protein [Kribbella flavida]ADB33047.1 Activator of Hsp90 ATPase 1 family protein [Kribbella flavida DSM 17836]